MKEESRRRLELYHEAKEREANRLDNLISSDKVCILAHGALGIEVRVVGWRVTRGVGTELLVVPVCGYGEAWVVEDRVLTRFEAYS